MDNNFYILDENHNLVKTDIETWAAWFEGKNRLVKKDKAIVKIDGINVGEITVSTIFLGLDHAFGGESPMLFETMVFGGPIDQAQDRCGTWDGALKMHELMMN